MINLNEKTKKGINESSFDCIIHTLREHNQLAMIPAKYEEKIACIKGRNEMCPQT